MKKIVAILLVFSLLVGCTNDVPSSKQEEKTIDSLVDNEQAASDSMMKAIQAEIGSDTLPDEGAE
jgi:hypothetical protein